VPGAGLAKNPSSRAFSFIPTHSSWLNQVECWFSISTSRRALQGSSFTRCECWSRRSKPLSRAGTRMQPLSNGPNTRGRRLLRRCLGVFRAPECLIFLSAMSQRTITASESETQTVEPVRRLPLRASGAAHRPVKSEVRSCGSQAQGEAVSSTSRLGEVFSVADLWQPNCRAEYCVR
jgi:hypothetical protein